MFTILEPRWVAVSDLGQYAGWTLQPTLSDGAMIQGRIIEAAPLQGDNTAIVITLESRDGRGRYVEAAHVLNTTRADFFKGATEPRIVEVAIQRTVPDCVPSYDALFDRVDARGLSIVDAIASFQEA